MNNIELEQKIKEILAIENYFDMQLALNEFRADYKQSDFYKATKMSLEDVLKNARIHYGLQLENVSKKLQKVIDNLSLDKLELLFDQISQVFGKENSEIGDMLKTFTDLQ